MENPIPDCLGNEELLALPATAFLCSRRIDDEAWTAIRHWVHRIDDRGGCVRCGCLSPAERFAARLLMERGVPLVLVLAEALPVDAAEVSRRLPDLRLSEAMGAGRLLVVSVNPDAESVAPTGANAEARNRWMMDTAERIVVAYARPYGKLDCQTVGHPRVTRLVEAAPPPHPTEKQRTNLAWGIYHSLRRHAQELSSTDLRRLLHRYLQLDTARPSLLHSLVLRFVVQERERLHGLNFPAFLHLWGPGNLRPEDWEPSTAEGNTLSSLADRVRALLGPENENLLDGET